MKIIADLHTHTIKSSDGYSTINEMIEAARKKDLMVLGNTDHAPNLGDYRSDWLFRGLSHFVPRNVDGLIVLRGIELNIGETGDVDLDEEYLSKLDYAIASIHRECFNEKDPKRILEIYLKILENPYVDILGHLGNRRFPFDYEKLISKCNEYGKVVEVNNSSHESRPGSEEYCKEIVKLCKAYKVPVVVNSDAHSIWGVGEFDYCLEILKEVDFPEELVLNADFNRLRGFFLNKKNKDIFI